jgi:EAL domain-containing protein (putative c-di-GMP-specific phosphodiesterase class I)
MPIKQVVEYCNARWKADAGLCEALLTNVRRRVTARFGEIELASEFDPIRLADAPAMTVGSIARLRTGFGHSAGPQPLNGTGAVDPRRVVNFDRLCRTMHMLNYLGTRHDAASRLVLDVDPMHILSVPHDHGAYFTDVIQQCGLGAEQIVLSTSLELGAKSGDYLHRLGLGLANYRSRGYQIAVKLDELPMSKATANFFFKLAPDYLRADCRRFGRADRATPSGAGRYLGLLQRLMYGFGGKVILERIYDEHGVDLAREAGVDWIQGAYLERPKRRSLGVKPAHTPFMPGHGGVYVQAI